MLANKHIFYIHSNITLLVSLAVSKQINPEEVIFLIGRKYTIPHNYINCAYKTIELNDYITFLEKTPTSGSYATVKNLKGLTEIDKILYGLGKFECYLPSVNNFLFQAIATNRNCTAYNIIEEGLLTFQVPSMYLKNYLSIKLSLINVLKKTLLYPKHLNRSGAYNLKKAKYNHTYVISKDILGINPSAILVSINGLETNLINNSINHLFILDNLDVPEINKDEYFRIIKSLSSEINDLIYIKSHPANHAKYTEEINSWGNKYKLLPETFPLEIYFNTKPQTKVYGFVSSLLIYAANADLEVECLLTKLGVESPLRVWSKRIMPTYFFDKLRITDL